jgi:predicted CoA-binding protein
MTSTTTIVTEQTEDEALQRAMRALLHPRRIAIIGASPRMGFANSIHSALHRGEYDGEILPVNPRYEEVLGDRAYPTIEAIEGPIDLAVVVVPNRFTMDVLAQCERKGVGAVDLIASGLAPRASRRCASSPLAPASAWPGRTAWATSRCQTGWSPSRGRISGCRRAGRSRPCSSPACCRTRWWHRARTATV